MRSTPVLRTPYRLSVTSTRCTPPQACRWMRKLSGLWETQLLRCGDTATVVTLPRASSWTRVTCFGSYFNSSRYTECSAVYRTTSAQSVPTVTTTLITFSQSPVGLLDGGGEWCFGLPAVSAQGPGTWGPSSRAYSPCRAISNPCLRAVCGANTRNYLK